MIDAARQLFLEQGYGATSIDEIADAAGVAAPTVYAKFGSKAGLLKVVVDVTVAGDDEDIPLAERPEFVTLVSDAPVSDRVRMAADHAHEIHARAAPMLRVLAGVAGADPAVAELHAAIQVQIRTTAELFVTTIRHALRPGLAEEQAVDLLDLYAHPDAWVRLVLDDGWTREQYVEWLVDVIERTMLDEDALAREAQA